MDEFLLQRWVDDLFNATAAYKTNAFSLKQFKEIKADTIAEFKSVRNLAYFKYPVVFYVSFSFYRKIFSIIWRDNKRLI